MQSLAGHTTQAQPPKLTQDQLREKLSAFNIEHAGHGAAFGDMCHICMVNATHDVNSMSINEANARAFIARHSPATYVKLLEEINEVLLQVEPSLCVTALKPPVVA